MTENERTLRDLLDRTHPPQALDRRVDPEVLPHADANRQASAFLFACSIGLDAAPLGGPTVYDDAARLALRYGHSAGADQIHDAAWCGLPLMVGHLAALSVVADCRTHPGTAGDEQLLTLAENLIAQLWPKVGSRARHSTEKALPAAMALHRHATQWHDMTRADLPKILELTRVGMKTGTMRAAAVYQLIRRVLDQHTRSATDMDIPRAVLADMLDQAAARSTPGAQVTQPTSPQ